jgi:tetratricopeptide (TPR) repeat protein
MATTNQNQNQNQEIAEKIKTEANVHFNKNEFKKAIEMYTQAIQIFPRNAIYYSNRALAYIKLEEYGRALEDANKAIELDPKYIKAYFRRGCCYLALGKYVEALQDLRRVIILSHQELFAFISKQQLFLNSRSLCMCVRVCMTCVWVYYHTYNRLFKSHPTTKMPKNSMSAVEKNTLNSRNKKRQRSK